MFLKEFTHIFKLFGLNFKKADFLHMRELVIRLAGGRREIHLVDRFEIGAQVLAQYVLQLKKLNLKIKNFKSFK